MAYFPTSIMPMYNGNIPVNQVLSELINYVKFPIVHIDGDKIPYNFRPTNNGTRNIGDRETDMLVGGTVAFNQLVQNNFSVTNGTMTQSGTEVTVTVTNTSEQSRIQTEFYNKENHVYLRRAYVKASQGHFIMSWYGALAIFVNANGSWQEIGNVIKSNYESQNWQLFVGVQATDCPSEYKVKDVVVIDLTAIFGSTIADYIYSLEQGTAGAGVAWFRNLFPKSYYAYNTGTLMSVKTSKHITVGRNAFNPETGKAKLLGGNKYQLFGNYTSYSYSTGETITLDSDDCFVPSENGELTIVGGDSTTTFVGLYWDGEYDHIFAPYIKHEYDYSGEREVTRYFGYRDYESGDESLTDAITDGTHTVYKLATPYTETVSNPELRGIPKLDANNKLYYYGDICSDLPNPQIVDDFGTEEYVDNREVAIPVGHETIYQTPISV